MISHGKMVAITQYDITYYKLLEWFVWMIELRVLTNHAQKLHGCGKCL